jgi:hypothetical protein
MNPLAWIRSQLADLDPLTLLIWIHCSGSSLDQGSESIGLGRLVLVCWFTCLDPLLDPLVWIYLHPLI